MNSNKKIFGALIVLIIFLSVNAVSAAENVSDIIASDDSAAVSEISMFPDEKLEAASTHVVTNETFTDYFTEDGALNDNVSAGSTLDFQGTFTGEAYKMNITKPVNIISSTGDGLFNEIGKNGSAGGIFLISSGGSGTNVSDIQFINSTIYVDCASGITISNIISEYVMNESCDAYAIHAESADGLTIKDSEIKFDAKNNGSFINNAVYVFDSSYVKLQNNIICAEIPSCYVNWKQDSKGKWVKAPISEGLVFDECEELLISGNQIQVAYNDVVGAYDTLYAVDITNSIGVIVTENDIEAAGRSYIYGLYVEANGLSIDNNNFTVSSDINYANGMEIEASVNAFITNNTFDVSAPNFAYSIYSGMNGGELKVDYFGNIINANADIAYGMELCGSIENVYSNMITVEGNKTIALAIKSQKVDIYRNTIQAFGDNLGNSSSPDSFDAMTVAINLQNCKATVEENEIYSTSRGIVANGGIVNITNNDMTVKDNALDDSYAIMAEDSDIEISDNEIVFTGNTDGSTVNNVVNLKDCAEAVVINNSFDISIPSASVNWVENPPGSGNWVKIPATQGLVFDNCTGLELDSNNIELEATSVVGFFDTIYVIDITDSDYVNVTNNNVYALGHSYIYGLYIESDSALVDSNNFTIESDNNYANGIEIEASVDTTISNNNIEVAAPAFAYPIYSGMNGGDLEVDYIKNNIHAVSDIVYAMELCGSKENVFENTITAEGNKTTALAIKSKEAYVYKNTINALGDNLGNSSSLDSFVPMTAGINLQNTNTIVEENTINSTSRGIFANGGIVTVENNEINVNDNGMDDSYAIIADASDIIIKSNYIEYFGNTNGSTINNALNLVNCENPVVEVNEFGISIPSAPVVWEEIPAGSWNWVKIPVTQGLVFDNCTDLELDSNGIALEAASVVGAYDTVYVIDITDSDNVNVTNNGVFALGHDYIYGLYIESDNAFVDSNNFTIASDTNYANGIEIEASTGTTISNNKIEVSAPAFAYPVYSGMNGGDLEVEYVGNSIYAISDIVYGMELCGSKENVYENIIVVEGNKTTALAVKSQEANIAKNAIDALGANLGNSSSLDSFAAMTAGINLQNSAAIVEKNIINSTSRGIVANGDAVLIDKNLINVKDNGLDDSYAIIAENSDIAISENEILYIGNTTGSTVNNAVNIKNCTETEVVANSIDVLLPSCYVSWKEEPAGSGNWVANPISEGILIDSPKANVENNIIAVGYDGIVGAYDTIYAVHVISDNATITSNNILANGHSYIYGLEVSGSDFAVKNNTIAASSDSIYANGIDIEGEASGVIENNIIGVNAPGVTYAIYSAMSNGNVSVDYLGNKIESMAPLAYGMELTGLEENVVGNDFLVVGESAVGIYSSSGNVSVIGNAFEILSNSTESTAFMGKSGNAIITDNEVAVDGEYTVDVSKITALVKDNYLIGDELTGDASVSYDPATSSVYNNTPKMDKYFITSEGLEKYFGNAKQLEFTLLDAIGKPVANETVSIVINGKSYNRTTDENGTARIGINLNSGNYTVTATYENNSYDAPVTILTTIEGNDITKMFKNATQYEATFVDVDGNALNKTEVQFNINGVMYKRTTDENGTARLTINLPQGEYVITAINPVNGEMHANNITVLATIANNTDLTKYYKNDSQYVVKILGSDGNPVKAGEVVTFNINGVFYNRTTDENGTAKLNINLRPGEYVITASYNGCSVANNITVLTTLETKDMSMKYKDGSKFEAKVLDGQGNALANQTVQFNINGVLYDRVSGNDGIAKLAINLMAGQYIITSAYNGYSTSNKITISS